VSGRVGEEVGLLGREQRAAREIRTALERSRVAPITLRDVRDVFGLPRGLLRRRRPTWLECRVIEQALATEGTRPRRPLAELGLDDTVELEKVNPVAVEEVRRGRLWCVTSRAARRVYWTAGALATAITIYQFARPEKPPPIARMDGHVNIAVAPFDVSTAADDDLRLAARAIGKGVYEKIASRVRLSAPRLGLEVRGPSQVGHLDYPARDAPQLSQKIGADIVIYGRLSQTPVLATLAPRLYISRRVLPGAEELAGFYSFGRQLVAQAPASNAITLDHLEEGLTARTSALAKLILGLAYFQAHDYSRAYRPLLSAARDRGWSGPRPEIVELALANAAIKQGKYQLAASNAARALAIQPTLRARFAWTEAVFLRDKGACEQRRINAGAVRRALVRYLAIARTALRQRSGIALILRAKAQFGAGRAYFCLSQALSARHWTDARKQYDRVIRAYQEGVAGITEQAAEAYAGLGTLAVPAVGEPHTEASLRTAVRQYREAIALTGGATAPSESHSRQAVFRSNLAEIYVQLRDLASAKDQLQRAVDKETDRATRESYEQRLVELR
jgi:tetratricopeptide (TPR) repeat protein